MQCPVSVETIWLANLKSILKNTFFQQSQHQVNQARFNIQRLASCHLGLERTLRRFKELKNVWQFQRQHVRHFIDICPCCQNMSMLKIPIHAHNFTTSTYTPMGCLNIDFLGPFPDKGYILVIVCTFTRWVELYLTTDATALSAAECLIKHFGRFGTPRQLRSDNGPHFIAAVIKNFLP